MMHNQKNIKIIISLGYVIVTFEDFISKTEISESTALVSSVDFTFSIPRFRIQLSQMKPTNAHSFIEITVVLKKKPTPTCFGTPPAHHQGSHNCTKSLQIFLCSRVTRLCNFVPSDDGTVGPEICRS